MAVFAACSTHTSVRAAAEEAGVGWETVKYWKKTDPDWYERCKQACARTRAIERSKKGLPAKAVRWDEVKADLDFLTFRERFFKRKNFWFHSDAYGRIEATDRLIMLVPPNHAKTTVWSIEYVTYKLMMDPSLRIAVIQKSQVEAKKVIAAVKERLTSHEFYQNLGIPIDQDPITVYGGELGFKPAREDGLSWSAEAFYLRQRDMTEKDPSLQAKGWTSSLLGNRIDMVIVDDVQDDKNYTPQGLEGLKTWWTHTLMSRLDGAGKDSKAILLGSRIGPGDFYEWIEESYALMDDVEYPEDEVGFRWPIKKYPAVLNEATRELLAPDLWDWDKLMKKKFEVRDKWWSNWMQVNTLGENSAFDREAMLRARDSTWAFGWIHPEVTHVVLGCDPATSGYCAIVAWGVNAKTGRRFLLDVFNERGMRHWPAIIERLSHICDSLHTAGMMPRELVIEMRNVQGSLAEDPRLREEMAKRGVRITTYTTVASSGAAAEESDFRISSIGELYDADLVLLPYGDERSRKAVDAYIDQCCNWRPKPAGAASWHLIRDMVMATLFAESVAREIVRIGQRPAPKPQKPRLPKFVTRRAKQWKEGVMPLTGVR